MTDVELLMIAFSVGGLVLAAFGFWVIWPRNDRPPVSSPKPNIKPAE